MNRKFVFLALLVGAVTAGASPVVTLENTTSVGHGEYDWSYTLSNGDLDIGYISSIEFFDVGGVSEFGSFGPNLSWFVNVGGCSGGLCDVTFYNYGEYVNTDSLSGFVIQSSDNTSITGSYSVNYYDPSIQVPGPAASAPEPATLGLTGLALLALGSFKRRRNVKNRQN